MTVADPQSLEVDIDGPVHYLDYGGPSGAPMIVAVHGLGGAAWNWAAIAPLLVDQYRLVAIDLAGHGLTPGAGRPTTVAGNRRLLERFLDRVTPGPVILLGNSMGGLITALQAAATPERVQAAVLVDPAMPRPFLTRPDPQVSLRFALLMLPGLGEAALARQRKRHTSAQQVRETLALCTVDPARIPPDVVARGIEVTETRRGDEFAARDFLYAARSLLKLLSRPGRLHQRLSRIAAPVLLVNGDQDRLVPLSVARAAVRRHPNWTLAVAHDCGHVPMLEAPDWTADTIHSWLTGVLGQSASSEVSA